jgi:hypothetical protein
MGGKMQRQKELEEARRLRDQREVAKKDSAMRKLRDGWTVEATAKAVHASESTIQQWKRELGNG